MKTKMPPPTSSSPSHVTEIIAEAIRDAQNRYKKQFDVAIAIKVALKDAGFKIVRAPKTGTEKL